MTKSGFARMINLILHARVATHCALRDNQRFTTKTSIGFQVLLSIEAIRQEVDDYAARAYKMGKANKEVSTC